MSVSPDATKDALKREYAREDLEIDTDDELQANCTMTYTSSCII